MAKEPTLEELGLDTPAKISGKISIERLQRESDYEVATAKVVTVRASQSSGLSANVLAGLLSFLIPGAGHLVKGRSGPAIAWFVATVLIGAFSAFVPILFPALIVVWLGCVVSAVVSERAQ